MPKSDQTDDDSKSSGEPVEGTGGGGNPTGEEQAAINRELDPPA